MRSHAIRMLALVFALATVSFLLSPATFAQTVTNGSFEAVQIGTVSSNPADIPGLDQVLWRRKPTVWMGDYGHRPDRPAIPRC